MALFGSLKYIGMALVEISQSAIGWYYSRMETYE
jgi:hypothetical protein